MADVVLKSGSDPLKLAKPATASPPPIPARVRIIAIDLSIVEMIPIAFKAAIATTVVSIGFGIIGAVLYGIYKAVS